MTPEERAKATWRECFDGRRSTKAAVSIIAQAITQAENDKLEEAARALRNHSNPMLRAAAGVVTALKKD